MEVWSSVDGLAMDPLMVNSDISSRLNTDGLVLDWIEAGICCDRTVVAPTAVVCSFLDGFNSDGLTVPQIVAGNVSVCLGVASMEDSCNYGLSSEGRTMTQLMLDTTGVSSVDSIVTLGKANGVDMIISMVSARQ